MNLFHNSQNLIYRAPFGALPAGNSVTLKLDVADFSNYPEANAFLLLTLADVRKEIPMTRAEGGFCCEVTPEECGIYWYSFKVINGSDIFFYGNNARKLGGAGEIYTKDPLPYQITVYKEDHFPKWYQEGIVYQIFPDRFARSNNWMELQQEAQRQYYLGCENVTDTSRPARRILEDWNSVQYYPRTEQGGIREWVFSGGTLEGIRSKLDYLKDLGITIIYLNPIFKAASNHKYDTYDYMLIDEGFGNEEDFRRLCADARERGIRIILDGVFNHTGADSKYFNLFGRDIGTGAYQGESSQYRSWYTFTENGYDSWWGIRDLPNVNEMNDSYRDYIINNEDSVIRHWLKAGASGWRLDVADELPDEFIKEIRSAMTEEDPENILLGEVWEDASNKTSYGELRKYFWGEELQSTMNYPFRTSALDFIKGNITPELFCAQMMSLKENYPKGNYYSNLNLIGSHDRARSITALSDCMEELEKRFGDSSPLTGKEKTLKKEKYLSRADAIKEAFSLPEDKLHLAKERLKLLSLLQFVMPGVPCIYYGDEAGMEGHDDPYNRGTFPWGREDKELTAHYSFLCDLRKSQKVLLDGDFLPFAASKHVICLKRFNENEQLWLFANRGIFEWETINFTEPSAQVVNASFADIHPESGSITVPPLGWVILKL